MELPRLMSRLPDPTASFTGQDLALFQSLMAKRGHVDGMYRTLLNHPELTRHVSSLGTYLRFESTLPGDIREFVILALAHRLKVDYEWMEHIGPALHAGLAQTVIDSIKADGEVPERYQLYLAGLKDLIALRSLPEEVQGGIIAQVSVKGLVEYVILVGFYRMIAGVITAFDVPLPSQ